MNKKIIGINMHKKVKYIKIINGWNSNLIIINVTWRMKIARMNNLFYHTF